MAGRTKRRWRRSSPLAAGGAYAAGASLSAAAGGVTPPAGGTGLLAAGAVGYAAAGAADGDEDADMEIAGRVEEALAGDAPARRGSASPWRKGRSSLREASPPSWERRTAAETCARVPGVRAVENRLSVAPAAQARGRAGGGAAAPLRASGACRQTEQRLLALRPPPGLGHLLLPEGRELPCHPQRDLEQGPLARRDRRRYVLRKGPP